ncbi:MAG: acyl carrier protein [Bacteroidota bacterium]
MREELIEYIKAHLLVGQSDLELLPEDDLLGSGLVDSMGMMKLIGHIEEKYQFTIPPQDMTIENFMTVEAISNYLQEQKV